MKSNTIFGVIGRNHSSDVLFLLFSNPSGVYFIDIFKKTLVNSKMLSVILHSYIEWGLAKRVVVDDFKNRRSTRVKYVLTDKGRSVVSVMYQLNKVKK